jgi:hypothetical protein
MIIDPDKFKSDNADLIDRLKNDRKARDETRRIRTADQTKRREDILTKFMKRNGKQ